MADFYHWEIYTESYGEDGEYKTDPVNQVYRGNKHGLHFVGTFEDSKDAEEYVRWKNKTPN